MKKWMKWLLLLATVAFVVAGIVQSLSARKAKSLTVQAQLDAQKSLNPIDIAGSALTTVRMLDLQQTVLVTGNTKAVHSAIIKARVPGELQGLTVREGDKVQAGQVLARIEDTEVKARLRQAQQQAQSAKAQLDIAQRTLDNQRALIAQGFISPTALETATANHAAAQSNYAAAQAAVDVVAKSLEDTVLRSPLNGHIAQRLAQPGERVGVEARILEVVDLRQIEVEVALAARESLTVQTGQTATITIDGHPGSFAARVARINPSASSANRSILAYLSLQPGHGLRQGLFVQATIHTGSTQTLALPLHTVRTDKPQPYVQALVNGKVSHIPVQLGTRAETQGQTLVAVTGIEENTPVLPGSAGSLREGTPVNILNGAQ